MTTKYVTKNNGIFSCDLTISVTDWTNILESDQFTKYHHTLSQFLKEPEHKATCALLGEKYSVSPQAFNSRITAFSKAVQKKLGQFSIVTEEGKETFWPITMLGKRKGKHFEWQLKPELVQAMKQLDIKGEHYLQTLYKKAIKDNHSVYSIWFPLYEKYVTEYRNQLLDDNWTDEVLHRLIKQNQDNGVAGLSQGNFTWDEYRKLKEKWHELSPLFQEICTYNSITAEQYWEIFNTVDSFTNGKRPSATNRLIAAFLPNTVTTAVNIKYLKEIIKNIQEHLLDYPDFTNDWLEDNKNFIAYCNKHVSFEHEWHSSLFAWYLKEHFDAKQQKIKDTTETMDSYMNLLEGNKNLILTGAPGTGKTYLAKQIAKAMDAELEFVQFHPSYDYTDFVEGLRPVKKDANELGFELKDGLFKKFCKKALGVDEESGFDRKYDEFITELSEKELQLNTPIHSRSFKVRANKNKSCIAIPDTENATEMIITKNMIKQYLGIGQIRDWKSYLIPISDYFLEKYKPNFNQEISENKKHVIIIDEINRGEISKIFGELFYSIDPGYRGQSGRVKTQYTNLIEESDIFKDGFYIPENVYIIGTMNDIDRSVESFDFAMRRRFAWCEVDVNERRTMWNGNIEPWKEEAYQKMDKLNSAIEEIPGLGSAFHIGPAYFLKLSQYDGDFKELWENHIKGILMEYLRGLPDSLSYFTDLKRAYFSIEEN